MLSMAENSSNTTDRSFTVIGSTKTSSVSESSATRLEIAVAAADLASVAGLEGLSLSRLAAELGMSKSGLYAHFSSKEELQLSAVAAAAAVFADQLEAAGAATDAGYPRLSALMDAWLDYLEGEPFSGGCFFAAVGAEFDDRPGTVRERLVELTGSWREAITDELTIAANASELLPETDTEQLAFELLAFLHEANRVYQLHDSAGAFRSARIAINATLSRAATDLGRQRATT
ncbi:MAG: AcrR family transcriptional regulator [Hyphomicrobiaceae bacterium]|jgi:AcrR family transcriptional regulator